MIGIKDGSFLEIGGGGKSDNSYNLMANSGWKGTAINSGGYWMGGKREDNVELLGYLVFPSNINDIFYTHNISNELDLLSIDIDSMDYHVWEALDDEKYRPRVVAIEMNPIFPFQIKAKQKRGYLLPGND